MLWNHQFGAKYGLGGPSRAMYEPGGQSVTETPIVSKGLIQISSLTLDSDGILVLALCSASSVHVFVTEHRLANGA